MSKTLFMKAVEKASWDLHGTNELTKHTDWKIGKKSSQSLK
jgi:hypothetical protein